MRAAQLIKYGGQDALQFTADAPKPQARPGEILVEVHAASVNPWDLKLRDGAMQQMIPMNFPATLGGDFAGVVSEIGEGASGFNAGDEVYGYANSAGGEGSFAEFTPVSVSALALKPTKLDFLHAAAAPLTAASAYQALIDTMHVSSGQRVLVHGGAGGIGSFAIQLAKNAGAYVVTTASGQDLEYVRSLGADEAIDYKSQSFETVVRNIDKVFDTVGGHTYMNSYEVLKPGGEIASMVEQPSQELMNKHQVTAHYISTRVTSDQLNQIATLIDQDILTVHIEKTYPLEEAADALESLQGPHRGKIVIAVQPDKQ